MRLKYLIFTSCVVALLVWLWPSTVLASDLDGPDLSETYTYTSAKFEVSGISESDEVTITIRHMLSCTDYKLVFKRSEGWRVEVWELLTGDYTVVEATADKSDLSRTVFRDFTITENEQMKISLQEHVPMTAWRLIKRSLLYIIAIPSLFIALIVARKKGIADKKLFIK